MSAEPTIPFPSNPVGPRLARNALAASTVKVLFEHRYNTAAGTYISQVRRSASGKTYLHLTKNRRKSTDANVLSHIRIPEEDLVEFFRLMQSTVNHLRTHRRKSRP